MSPRPDDHIPNSGTVNSNQGYVNSAFENDKNGINKNTMAIAETKPIMDFDDLLPHVGEFGRYQKILFLLMIPFAFFVAFVYFAQIFIIPVPEQHWCKIPELEHLTAEQRMALAIPLDSSGESKQYSKCSMYAVNFTEVLMNGTTQADPTWPIQPCQHGWEFNFTDIPYETIATELEWVCENESLATWSQSIFFLGAIVGGLIFGWVADRFGRIPALVGTNFMGFVAGVATAFAGSFWEFALYRFFVGFAFDNCFTMMYILVLEYVGPKWRTFVANMSIAIFFTFAACILPWLALYIANWKIFIIVTSAPLFFAVFTPWCVPESARWLVSQGKTERALTILKKFAKINGKQVDDKIYAEFSDSCARLQAEESENNNYSILDLFKTPRLRKITILLIVIWMIISLVFDGHVRSVTGFGLNLFITFSVACFTEFPADSLLTVILDRWGRRWLACLSLALSGIFCLFATVAPQGVYVAVLAICGRFFANISYNIGLQYAAELLPTVVRAQGVAFIHIMGYVASIVAPFVIYLGKFQSELPLLVLGVLGVAGGFLALYLPETLGKELPQTLTDGEEFGRDQKMWDFPCMSKQTNDENEEDDIEKIGEFKRAVLTQGTTGASLRASSRAELGSVMLQRSIRSRHSNRSTITSIRL